MLPEQDFCLKITAKSTLWMRKAASHMIFASDSFTCFTSAFSSIDNAFKNTFILYTNEFFHTKIIQGTYTV